MLQIKYRIGLTKFLYGNFKFHMKIACRKYIKKKISILLLTGTATIRFKVERETNN